MHTSVTQTPGQVAWLRPAPLPNTRDSQNSISSIHFILTEYQAFKQYMYIETT